VVIKKSLSYKIFQCFNVTFLGILGITTLLPIIHIIAISLSNNAAVTANAVGIWPKGFNTASYAYLMRDIRFFKATSISIQRVLIGTLLNLTLILLTAYPLAQSDRDLRGRKLIAWYFVFTTLFSGGLIPTYLLIRDIGLMNKFAVLILPGAVPVFSVIMLMNYIKGLPKELFEACRIDGAGHLTCVSKIVVPLATPSLATLALFAIVGHWNEWFSATIYINDSADWPLQSLLRSLIAQSNNISRLIEAGNFEEALLLSDRSIRTAQIVYTTLPILVTYPFLQKFFVKGIVVGSVKG